MKNKSMLAVFAIFLLITGLSCSTNKQQVTPIQNGIRLKTGDINVKIQFYKENTVRIVKWKNGQEPADSSLVVIQDIIPDLNIDVNENSGDITLTSDKISAVVSKYTGAVTYLNKAGNRYLSEKGLPEIKAETVKGEKAYSIQQNFSLSSDEGIYGLGQHQDGYMNYRGRTVKLVQTNTSAVSPFLISTKNYGILWDNYSKTIFTDQPDSTSIWSDVADKVDYYFIAGDNMDSVISGYRNLTGQAPMYGKWAYGYWQSKEHYQDRAELLAVADKYRKLNIPIDNIVQDWDYWDGNENWGQLYFDPKKYPHPAEMIDILHQQNFHLMVSIWCSFGPNTPVYKEMQKKGYLYPTVGWAGFKYFDAYNPAAIDLFWKYTNEGLFSKGVDAWWMDSTEPDVINAGTKGSTEYELKRMKDNYLGSFARYLNSYSLLVTEGVYKHQRAITDKKRVYILTRSTFAGQQRAAATTWSGDIGASWEVYKKQIAAGLNHSMSGIPYWTFDIGAFVLGGYGGVFTSGTDPGYQELYTRMFQLGTFCPIFRSHGSETPREIWRFGDFTPALVKFDNLRYRLMPYIYSLAHQVTANGYTIMRGLPMDFESDKNTYSIDDQFMFGPALMVCPVTDYMLNKPPLPAVLVTPEHFRTAEGKQGLNANYYKETGFKMLAKEKIDSCINVNWYSTGRPDYVTDSSLSIKWTGKLIPDETGTYQFNVKCYGSKEIILDGKSLPFIYEGVESYTDTLHLEAGREYDIEVRKENPGPGAFRMELYWKTPSIFTAEKKTKKRAKKREVYLPENSKWIDFWTGEPVKGGQTITADAPIDKIPLFVRAGAIVPMGPFVQYAGEKPGGPLEIRIYPGADGSFVLYNDEGENYNYEKGLFATIQFNWNDENKTLTIGERQGSFPGMLSERTFNIVLVNRSHGEGINVTGKPDKMVQYTGKEILVSF